MKPMYQGQIDVFCAAYAVVNAMRLLRGFRLLACRELFHEALLDLARDETAFRDVLNQQTDYTCWVDTMLERQKRTGALRIEHPFPLSARTCASTCASTCTPTSADPAAGAVPVEPGSSCASGTPAAQSAFDAPVPLDVLWTTFARWFAGGTRRAAVFQFVRYVLPADAQIRHWTCCCGMDEHTLQLYDSSLDLGSLHHLERAWLLTDERQAANGKVLIVPHTVRLLRPRFEYA